jgi:hypothetical protein
LPGILWEAAAKLNFSVILNEVRDLELVENTRFFAPLRMTRTLRMTGVRMTRGRCQGFGINFSSPGHFAAPHFLQEAQDLDIFLDAVQGDAQGAIVAGLTVDFAQAVIHEVELFDEGIVHPLFLSSPDGLTIEGQVPHMAAEGGGAQTVLGGQGAVGDAAHQGPVDFLTILMDAHRTGFRHNTVSHVALRLAAVMART